jgi:hypothetical protein
MYPLPSACVFLTFQNALVFPNVAVCVCPEVPLPLNNLTEISIGSERWVTAPNICLQRHTNRPFASSHAISLFLS